MLCWILSLGVICLQALCNVEADSKYPLSVLLYDDKNQKGIERHVVFNETDTYVSMEAVNFARILASFKLLNGSCIEMHVNDPPSYDNPYKWFYAIAINNWQLPPRFDNRIYSMKKCDTKKVTLLCPGNQYVKMTAWDSYSGLCNGIELKCYKNTSIPQLHPPDTVLKSHENDVNKQDHPCNIYIGYNLTRSEKLGIEFAIEKNCKFSDFGASSTKEFVGPALIGSYEIDKDIHINHSAYCKVWYYGVVGVELEVEQNSGCIKDFQVICKYYGEWEEK